MIPREINEFSFEKEFETLKELPVYDYKVKQIKWVKIKWVKISCLRDNLIIFPDKFKGENFNQGLTRLCFLFSCLSSIATVPSLLYRLFGNNDNWRQTQSFIIYLFYNNKRTTISITDNFPVKWEYDKKNKINDYWIWSISENNAIFCKLIEKAYIKYQLIYGKYNYFTSYKDFKSNICNIIFEGSLTSIAMKILINSETQTIFDNTLYNNMNFNEMFQEIIKCKNKNALITLARNLNFNYVDDFNGHAYSVIGAWEKRKGNMKKQVLCIKNPWRSGDNSQENFNYQSLKNSIKYFPEFVTFNEKYFNDQKSSIFIAPLDFLLENGVYLIEAHIPNYEKDFPSVKEQINLYNKLEKLFTMIQNDDVKNIYDSMIDKNKEITRVLSVGEQNTREIISDINNKDNYLITKNGENYCELRKRNNDNYLVTNLSDMFYKDYAHLAILTNNITGEKTYFNLDTILNSETKYYPNKSLTILNQSIKPNSKKNELFYEIKPKTYRNFYISEYKRIDYSNGYYIGWVYNGDKHGEGKYYWNCGDYYIGDWLFDDRTGKGKYYWNNGDYYIGRFSKGKIEGEGKKYYKNGDYESGIFNNDNFIRGQKRITYSNGSYEGGWKNGCENGYGEEIINGKTFKGNYINGKRHGKFKTISENGSYDSVEYEYGEKKFSCIIF